MKTLSQQILKKGVVFILAGILLSLFFVEKKHHGQASLLLMENIEALTVVEEGVNDCVSANGICLQNRVQTDGVLILGAE